MTESEIASDGSPDLVAQLRASLLRRAGEYAELTDLSLTTVSVRCVGDWEFLRKVRAGQNFTVKTYEKAMSWFDNNWPVAAASETNEAAN